MSGITAAIRPVLGICSQIATYTSRYAISTAKEWPIAAATAVGLGALKATGYASSGFIPYLSQSQLDEKRNVRAAVLEVFNVLQDLSHEEIDQSAFSRFSESLPDSKLSRFSKSLADSKFSRFAESLADSKGLKDAEKEIFVRLYNGLSANTKVPGLNKDEQSVLVNY